MSLEGLYRLLSERYHSRAARSVYASDYDGDYAKDSRLSGIGLLETIKEESRKGGDYETKSLWRTTYRLKKPTHADRFYVFECLDEGGDYNPYTGSDRYVSETKTWIIGEAEVYEEFYDEDGGFHRIRVEAVRDSEVVALAERVARGE